MLGTCRPYESVQQQQRNSSRTAMWPAQLTAHSPSIPGALRALLKARDEQLVGDLAKMHIGEHTDLKQPHDVSLDGKINDESLQRWTAIFSPVYPATSQLSSKGNLPINCIYTQYRITIWVAAMNKLSEEPRNTQWACCPLMTFVFTILQHCIPGVPSVNDICHHSPAVPVGRCLPFWKTVAAATAALQQ
eukprot:1150633-Pelagomonas_calceolata.AAC.10